MGKRIDIPFHSSNSPDISEIPVVYTVEHEEENIIQIHCAIDLTAKALPEWLQPSRFIIRQIYMPGNPGVYVTELGSISCKAKEAALFVDVVHEMIKSKEGLDNHGE